MGWRARRRVHPRESGEDTVYVFTCLPGPDRCRLVETSSRGLVAARRPGRRCRMPAEAGDPIVGDIGEPYLVEHVGNSRGSVRRAPRSLTTRRDLSRRE